MYRLDSEQGRLYRATCDAELGDARCRVNLSDARWRTSGTVASVLEPARLRVSLDDTVAGGWFSGGVLSWTGGPNDAFTAIVRAHVHDYSGVTLDLWEPPPRAVTSGDAFRLTAGCDKRFSTCRVKFANAANFQGFPHMPGNDFVMRNAQVPGQVLDGGSLFR